jgi:nitroimidazol reductase NimA-like FMN-containing flavoprotein (pyridoxamine 5'-phosphate oxidase superfamily)
MAVDKSGLEVLSEGECFALLETAPIGRVVYSDRALPVIVPVNFTIDGVDVVIRTGRRSRLATHAAGHVIAFEVDDIDAASRSGWSVVLTGFLHLVEDPRDVERLDRLGLRSWAPSAHDRYLRLRPDLVTGRRIPPAITEGSDDVIAPEFVRAD